MDALSVFNALQELGVKLFADGSHLYFRPRSAVPPELLEAMRRHKPELLQLAKAGAAPSIDHAVQGRRVSRPQPHALHRALLLTLGARHGYPALSLDVRHDDPALRLGERPDDPDLRLGGGKSIAQGAKHWQTFTRYASDDMLMLALRRAHNTWSDDHVIVEVTRASTSSEPSMTASEIIEYLGDHDGAPVVDEGRLYYVGPPLATSDPIHATLADRRDELLRLLTPFALWSERLNRQVLEPVPDHPGQWLETAQSAALCNWCSQPVADGDRLCCAEHLPQMDAIRMPWESPTAMAEISWTTPTGSFPLAGSCTRNSRARTHAPAKRSPAFRTDTARRGIMVLSHTEKDDQTHVDQTAT